MNPKVYVVQNTILAEIKYKLITDLGISEKYYKHCTVFSIYGTDQDSAVSLTVWIVILNLFIDTHEKNNTGTIYISPNNQDQLKINILDFVDDCLYQVVNPDSKSKSQFLRFMNRDTQLWRDLLYITGGGLFFSKYIYYFIFYIFISQNIPVLNNKSISDNIFIEIFTEFISIKRLSPYTPHKTLGYYKSLSGHNILKKLKTKNNIKDLVLY